MLVFFFIYRSATDRKNARKATTFLDFLLEDHCQTRLRDNTARKKKVFAAFAKVLQEAGFRLPPGADGVKKWTKSTI